MLLLVLLFICVRVTLKIFWGTWKSLDSLLSLKTPLYFTDLILTVYKLLMDLGLYRNIGQHHIEPIRLTYTGSSSNRSTAAGG